MREYLLSEGRRGSVPEPAALILISRWLHCPPWELENQEESWIAWALMVMDVTDEVAPILQERERIRSESAG